MECLSRTMFVVLVAVCSLQWVASQFNPAITACFYEAPVQSNSETFCDQAKHRLLIGDFDGKGGSDLICIKPTEGRAVVYKNLEEKIDQKFHFCTRHDDRLRIGDFNGDKRYDFLCESKNDRSMRIKILLSELRGAFNESAEAGMSVDFCTDHGSVLHLGDFNGDKITDLLCRNADGRSSIIYFQRNGKFSKSYTTQIDSCTALGDRLLPGDFNGDGRTDLLCHSNNGDMTISFSNVIGQFNGRNWKINSKWCTMSNTLIKVVDINGDGFDDLLCKDLTSYGQTYVAKNTPYQYFKNGNTYQFHFCLHGGEKNFFVGDFNGDQKSDLLCQTFAGTRKITVSHCA